MINVLLIRSTPTMKASGVAVYCNAIKELFANDGDINILPISDYATTRIGIFKSFYKWNPFINAIRNSHADILHINEFAGFTVLQAYVAALITKKKVVYTAHWHPFKMMRHPVRAKMFFNFFLKQFIRKKADVVITLNNEDTDYFRKFHSNIRQIPHWLRFDNANLNKVVQKKSNMILFVGRPNDPNKGIEYLYSLPENEYDIHVVGKGKIECRKDITQHIDVPNAELENLYAQASLLVVPSKYEAFSYVSLEALAFNTPVVMSDRVRISDYLHEYKWGAIFEYGNVESFHNAVKTTIGMDVERDEILNIFSGNRIKTIYKELYKGVFK